MEIHNQKIEQIKKGIVKLAMSATDVASKLEVAEKYIHNVIENEGLSEKEIVEVLKEMVDVLEIEGNEKEKLVGFAKALVDSKNKEKREEEYQDMILKRAMNSQKVDKVFPAIDFKENLGMIYAIRGYDEYGNEQTYIGISKGKLYEITEAKEYGIITTHEENIDTKFDVNTFVEYIEGKKIQATKLFREIYDFLKKYIIISEEFYYVLVSYIMMTYIYVLFQVIPYLWINGEKGTGKSTIMKLLNKLCFNPLFCSNINPANIFRQIDNDGSTIILDEFEKMYGEEKQEIVKLLNQGFNKDGVVPRCVGQNNQIKKFRSFSPKIMGGITNIDDVLFERCIKYTTVRIKDIKITKYRENKETEKKIDSIVQDLYIFGLVYAEEIKKIYDNREVEFEGNSLREDDLWNPLLCIAKIIDQENQTTVVTDNILSYAKKLSKEKFERYIENERRLQLLYALYEFLGQENLKPSISSDGEVAYTIESIYKYLRQTDKFNWIKSSSALGKKIKQWYNFDKRRGFDGKRKVTMYIFDEDTIIDKLKEEDIDISDFE